MSRLNGDALGDVSKGSGERSRTATKVSRPGSHVVSQDI